MTLVLQTYTNEKTLLKISKTFKTLFGLIAFSYIASRLSVLNLQEYSFRKWATKFRKKQMFGLWWYILS